MVDCPIFAIKYDEKYSAIPFKTVNVMSSAEIAAHARNQSSRGTKLLRSKSVFDLTPPFGRNWLNMGTSSAPVAVSKRAPSSIATSAKTKIAQYGRTYFRRRLRSFIARAKG